MVRISGMIKKLFVELLLCPLNDAVILSFSSMHRAGGLCKKGHSMLRSPQSCGNGDLNIL